MPSGSHYGSPGSHSSGGSSSGGGSYSSGGSSYGGSNSSGGGDSHYYGSSGYGEINPKVLGIFLLSIVIIVLIFFIPKLSTTVNEANAKIGKIKVDREYYLNMIEYAETHENFIVDAKITDRFYKEEFKKYYITYEITYQNGETSSSLRGYSYSVYSIDDLHSLTINSTIQVAVNSHPIKYSTDSIPMDYKTMKLSNDGEYNYMKAIARKNSWLMVLMFFLIGCSITGIVFIAIHKKKKKPEIIDNKIVIIDIVKPDTATATKKYCEYCGSVIPSRFDKCPYCGAGEKKGKRQQ